MDRVTQRLWRGVEGPRGPLSGRCCTELFDHPSSRTKFSLRYALDRPENTMARPPGAGFCGCGASSSIDRIDTLGVLRLRATSAVSRSVQDDGFVGELEYNW